MRTGLAWARARSGRAAARAALPARKERRLSLRDMFCLLFWLESTVGRESALAGYLDSRGLVGGPPTDWHIAELVPQAVDVGEHRLVRPLDVDGVRGRHPA